MSKRLFFTKLAHTAIWVFYALVFSYILYAGVWGELDSRLLVAVGLVVLEGIVLISFGWKCPLTIIGYRYSEEHEPGFDIFLPRWLAKNNKMIFSVVFAVEMVIILLRLART